MKFLRPYRGKRSSVVPNLLLLYWEQNLSLSFYNCFYLSGEKESNSFSLQKRLTTVFNTEIRPFILIRDGRLAIDYRSYGNLSDQLNSRLHSLSNLSLHLIILKGIKLKSSWKSSVASVLVMSGSEWSVFLKCTTCDPLTAADKPSGRWMAAQGERFYCSEWEREMILQPVFTCSVLR